MVLGDDYIYTNSYKQRFCVRRGVHGGVLQEGRTVTEPKRTADGLSSVSCAHLRSNSTD